MNEEILLMIAITPPACAYITVLEQLGVEIRLKMAKGNLNFPALPEVVIFNE